MANIYKSKFYDLLRKKDMQNYEFFTKKVVLISDKQWEYYEFNVDEDIFNNALEISYEKSKNIP